MQTGKRKKRTRKATIREKQMKFKIGDTLLDNNVFLAPMAGVTDLPFRLLCREQGVGMSVTEMVSAKAIL